MKNILPYGKDNGSKKEQVTEMFDSISAKYDLLNRLLSFGIDKIWRRRVRNIVRTHKHRRILDLATGTADLAIELAKLKKGTIIGVDLSEKMLAEGIEKVKQLKLEDRISLKLCDAESLLCFDDGYFNVVTVGFGVRNFENMETSFDEICRILAPGGLFCILEFSKPTTFPIKQLYRFYNQQVIPHIGKQISGSSVAYQYLPDSVKAFPEGKGLSAIINAHGFDTKNIVRLTGGIATIYVAIKKY